MTEDKTSPLETVADPSFTDPLSDVTRKERRALLGASVISQAIALGGLVPEKIEAFGITVSPDQKVSLLYLLAAVLAYFILGFFIYSRGDLERRSALTEKSRSAVKTNIEKVRLEATEAQRRHFSINSDDPSALMKDPAFLRLAELSDHSALAIRAEKTGKARIWFDVYVPLVFGSCSIFGILLQTDGFPGWKWVVTLALAAAGLNLTYEGWRARNKIHKFLISFPAKIRQWHFNRIMAQLKVLPEDSPARPKLQMKVKALFERKLEDLKQGIY